MTDEEILLRRLHGQFLLAPGGVRKVARGLCGLQAQFFSNALHALRIRCGHEIAQSELAPLCKTWTIRGTIHLIDRDDLPLFLHEGRERFWRPCDTMEDDDALTAERKRLFAGVILERAAQGISQREALKEACAAAGMTEAEAGSAFNAWGGLIRALCEAGKLCHLPAQKKAFAVCAPMELMPRSEARTELLRRYWTHYGPATVRDAAAFFAARQRDIRETLETLPVRRAESRGETFYWLENGFDGAREAPRCVFLAGFDPLLMGYCKERSLMLAPENIRGIFSLAGIVSPALLLDGRVAGRWKREGKKARATFFAAPDASARRAVEEAAAALGFKEITID